MTIQNPVGGSPEDPYEKYKKYGVDNETPEKRGKKFGDEPPKKPLPPGSFFLILLYKILDYFLSLGRRGSKGKICADLSALRDAFETMKSEDRSQDVAFLNQLSTIWHRGLEHSMGLKRTDAFAINFRAFVKKIQNYPEGEEHTFGYYLAEHTSEDWLPFPYMEMIQQIHEQYQRNPAESALALWIQDLNELISNSDSE